MVFQGREGRTRHPYAYHRGKNVPQCSTGSLPLAKEALGTGILLIKIYAFIEVCFQTGVEH